MGWLEMELVLSAQVCVLSFRLSPRFFFRLQVFSLLCVLFWLLTFVFVHKPKNSYYLLSSLIPRLHDEQFLIAHALYRSQNMRTDEPRGAVGLRFYTLPVPLHPTSITTLFPHPKSEPLGLRASIVKPPSTPAVPFAISYQGNLYTEERSPSSHWATRILGRIQSAVRG